jgi:prophage regulatory protein
MSDTLGQTPAAQPIGRLLPRPEVERETGLSRSTIYRLMGQGKFPRPLRTSHQRVGWPLTVIEAWKNSRPVADPSDI